MQRFNDLRIDYDVTAGACRIYDEDGEREIQGFSMEADLAGGAIIMVEGRMYEAREIYMNAREVKRGSESDHRDGAREAP